MSELDELKAENQQLKATIAKLEATIATLLARLNQNSKNSSKPPSQDKSRKKGHKHNSRSRKKSDRPQKFPPSLLRPATPHDVTWVAGIWIHRWSTQNLWSHATARFCCQSKSDGLRESKTTFKLARCFPRTSRHQVPIVFCSLDSRTRRRVCIKEYRVFFYLSTILACKTWKKSLLSLLDVA